MSDQSADGTVHYYVGEDDCKKARCNREQEFPDADDPYCIIHSLEDHFSEDCTICADTNHETDQ